MATPINDAAWLRRIEQSLEEHRPGSAGAEASRPSFCCRLDEQPDHLAPEYALRGRVEQGQEKILYFNPECWLGRNGPPPKPIADALVPLLGVIANERELLCVRDAGTRVLQPFSLSSSLQALLGDVRPGDRTSPWLPGHVRRALAMAGVLAPEDWASSQRAKWNIALAPGADVFRRRGFLPLRHLIHPFLLSALRRYYRGLVRSGLMTLGDGQCSRRYVMHNDRVACFFHHELVPLVSSLVEKTVKPSYVYVGSYQEGATLEMHTDREQCEFSISLCIDYAPEPGVSTAWPIHLHTATGPSTVFQAIGDGLLYRGREIPHSRGTLPRGHTSTSIFFSLCSAEFRRSLELNGDQRSPITTYKEERIW